MNKEKDSNFSFEITLELVIVTFIITNTLNIYLKPYC